MNIMLSNTRLFRGIGSDELPLLLQCLGAAQKHYDRGETILAEGAPTEQLGMVLTSRCWARVRFEGSLSPECSRPERISSRIKRYSCSYRLSFFCFSSV